MTSITPEQQAQFKKKLLTLKARIEGHYEATLVEERGDTEDQASGELADYDPNDPGDGASTLVDREREFADTENTGRILTKINRALEKIEDGTYGLSDIDGSPIPIERLKVLPYALTTVDQEDSI